MSRFSLPTFALLVSLPVSVWLATSASAQRRFEILDLGDLNGPSFSVLASINDDGVICGFSDLETPGTFFATVWRDGRATQLGVIEGDDISDAAAINIGQTIVGTSTWIEQRGHITIFHPTAVLFEGDTITELESLVQSGQNWDLLACAEINDAGVIIGNGFDRDAQTGVAYRFEAGTLTSIPTLGGFSTSPVGINEAGAIVGQSWTSGGQNHAFVYENGVMTDLGTFGGRDSRAIDITEGGVIVGWSQSPSSPTLATLWRNHVAQNLGTLGGNQSHCAAINEREQVVGFSTDANNHSHMFWWENGQMINPIFHIPPGQGFAGRATAVDINEAGQFIGSAYRTDVGDAPVVLTPVDLTLSNLVPGIAGQENAIFASGLTPGERAFILVGTSAGMTQIPGCPGATVLISGPKLAKAGTADAAGRMLLQRHIPARFAGRTFRIQAAQKSRCTVSNVVNVTLQ